MKLQPQAVGSKGQWVTLAELLTLEIHRYKARMTEEWRTADAADRFRENI